MAKESRKDEIAAAATTRKLKRNMKRGAGTAASPGGSRAAGMCDDIVRNILARLPVRTVVASMALSKHHQSMVLCPEFASLHRRLRPPAPQRQVAYVATARMLANSSGFHGFHVADAGRLGCNAPMRSLTGTRYVSMKYVNTCNGVLLFADSQKCVLWNPCLANSDKEVIIPDTQNGDRVLGWGYGTRSEPYKLLLARECKGNSLYGCLFYGV